MDVAWSVFFLHPGSVETWVVIQRRMIKALECVKGKLGDS